MGGKNIYSMLVVKILEKRVVGRTKMRRFNNIRNDVMERYVLIMQIWWREMGNFDSDCFQKTEIETSGFIHSIVYFSLMFIQGDAKATWHSMFNNRSAFVIFLRQHVQAFRDFLMCHCRRKTFRTDLILHSFKGLDVAVSNTLIFSQVIINLT